MMLHRRLHTIFQIKLSAPQRDGACRGRGRQMAIRFSKPDEGVVTLLMDRPEKRNAFTWEMYEAFGAACDALQADDAVRCVVVRGAGGAFCAGSDIGGFDENRSGVEQARRYAEFTIAMFEKFKN